MMRLILVVLLFPALMQGQDYLVTGRVVDGQTGESVICANVIVRYRIQGSDSVRSAGAVTNTEGEFVFRLRTPTAPDTIQIAAYRLNYDRIAITRTFSAETDVLDIGELRLPHDALWKSFIRQVWDPGWKFNSWSDFKHTNFRSIIMHEEIMALPVQ